MPRMPFWRGDAPRPDYELGQRRWAHFAGELAERGVPRSRKRDAGRAGWQRRVPPGLRLGGNAVDYLAGQLDVLGAISSDRTVLVEVFEDALGDLRMVIHSCFGGRVNGPWGLALAGALRERTGSSSRCRPTTTASCSASWRPTATPAGPGHGDGAGRGPRAHPARAARLGGLWGALSPERGPRAAAARGAGRQKRTPFWLQRLRAKDLLQVVRGFDDFPDRGRDLPRLPAGRARPAAPGGGPGRHRAGRDRGGGGRVGGPQPGGAQPAVRLYQQSTCTSGTRPRPSGRCRR